MARKAKAPAPTGGVPAWFMTYSDVVTLLMTFFILLLTFATSEPERFAQMQAVTFGGGGATGLAGDRTRPVDQDALVVRVRPSASRVGQNGSELPPETSDAPLESLNKGLAGLDAEHPLAGQEAFRIAIDWDLLFDRDGELTDFARQRIRMLAAQLQRLPLQTRLEVPAAGDLEPAIRFADRLIAQARIRPGRVSVGVRPAGLRSDRELRVIVNRRDDLRPQAGSRTAALLDTDRRAPR